MALFKITDTSVKKITLKKLDLEKNLQKLFETNLQEILGITFLAHEYPTSFGGRIDTLGIDNDGSPCIIEYKKGQNDSVINQGLSYLYWLMDHKAEFERLTTQRIEWDSPRVICIAENYNKFDRDTADFLPINIELFKYSLYDGNMLYLEPVSNQKVNVSLSAVVKKSKNTKEKNVRLQKTYTLQDYLTSHSEEMKDLFLRLREKILAIDEEIREEPKKLVVAYKLSTNFVDLEMRSKDVKVFLNVKSGQLHDPKNLARDLTKPQPVGHWGTGDYEMKVHREDEIEDVFSLIMQSYHLNK